MAVNGQKRTCNHGQITRRGGILNWIHAKPPDDGGGPQEVVVANWASNPGSVIVENGADVPVPVVDVAPQVLSIRSAFLPVSV